MRLRPHISGDADETSVGTDMRAGAIFSGILHAVVLALAYFGLPLLVSPEPALDTPIPVQILIVEERTMVPTVRPKREKPTPPKPRRRLAETPAPPPPPAPSKAPEPPKVAVAPSPPEPAHVAKPRPLPKLEPRPEPKPPEQIAALKRSPKPKPKPAPPKRYEFASVLKSVEKLRKQKKPKEEPPPKKAAKPAPPPPPPPPEKQVKVAKVVPEAPIPERNLGNRMTASEIDAVRRQIEQCWNVPIGAKDAKNLVIEIRVLLNPDGSVRRAIVLNKARMLVDSFFRAAAESARRAVLQCSPLTLPLAKYDDWQTITLSFNPKNMFGT